MCGISHTDTYHTVLNKNVLPSPLQNILGIFEYKNEFKNKRQ